jgi:hypothetical protein
MKPLLLGLIIHMLYRVKNLRKFGTIKKITILKQYGAKEIIRFIILVYMQPVMNIPCLVNLNLGKSRSTTNKLPQKYS